ncbi:pre-mRNA cleavage factor Im 25 kDa subunit 2 [Rhizoctonia solani]|uniref:Pre-mRNA cleavage factor Im 25 kDa subunit 2 n=1 Tax=Rhizoctonia solani TaxID=456999 RepID=A0A8H8NZI2_9AGAM|nr:pre-mRNA cleavage factor Im 25 kDa subunit 2 [Rhizoctonia solani]QRW22804.1 pre-mRNA cleavage factor Im 25 kDa subunit 2 [Rhizoctonia solani]
MSLYFFSSPPFPDSASYYPIQTTPETRSTEVLAVPKNMKLLAIPLFELYDNAARLVERVPLGSTSDQGEISPSAAPIPPCWVKRGPLYLFPFPFMSPTLFTYAIRSHYRALARRRTNFPSRMDFWIIWIIVVVCGAGAGDADADGA